MKRNYISPFPLNFNVEERTLRACINNPFFHMATPMITKTTPDNIDVGGCGGHVPKSKCVIVFITDTGRIV